MNKVERCGKVNISLAGRDLPKDVKEKDSKFNQMLKTEIRKLKEKENDKRRSN